MIAPLFDISHLYEAGEIVYYKKDLYKISGQLHSDILNNTIKAYNIFGEEMAPDEAAAQLLLMVDNPAPLSRTAAIYHNMDIGKQILALWREYVMIKSDALSITGQGIPQLKNFFLIECALLGGMLNEASQMISEAPEDSIVTPLIKQRFSTACLTANRKVN